MSGVRPRGHQTLVVVMMIGGCECVVVACDLIASSVLCCSVLVNNTVKGGKPIFDGFLLLNKSTVVAVVARSWLWLLSL